LLLMTVVNHIAHSCDNVSKFPPVFYGFCRLWLVSHA
jgi:hypothetical protein